MVLGTCLNVGFLELNWNYHRTEAKEGKSCWVQITLSGYSPIDVGRCSAVGIRYLPYISQRIN